jgi:hypothetical protein
MTEEFESVVQRAGGDGPVVFSEAALEACDGKVVPLTLEPGGPVIGEATLTYESEGKALKALFRVDDPKVAEFLKNDPPNIFG